MTIFSCERRNKKIINPIRKEISEIHVYCWCFNLDYFKYNNTLKKDGEYATLEGFQLCHTPINLRPRDIVLEKNYKRSITSREKINSFKHTILLQGEKKGRMEDIDARLVFLIEYKDTSVRDTLVYMDSKSLWISGTIVNYSNEVNSVLNEVCGDYIRVCPSN